MKILRTRGSGCRRAADLPAYLQSALPPDEAAEMTQHLAACPECSALAADFRNIRARLGEWPDTPPDRSLADRVMARVADESARKPALFALPWLRAAALLACLLAGWAAVRMLRRPEPAPSALAREALHWLFSVQEPDGHWDAARWGAQKQYAVGIHSLALLACLTVRPEWPPGEPRRNIERAVQFLVAQQNGDGRLGPLVSGTPYNHGLGTLALIEACALDAQPAWKEAGRKALAYILATQRDSGGWDYPRAVGDRGNASIVVWQIQALLRAEELGWPGLRTAIDRAMSWMATVTDERGIVGYRRPGDFPYGYETLTAAGALCALLNRRGVSTELLNDLLARLYTATRQGSAPDYCRLYFLTRALQASGGEQALRMKRGLQQRLLALRASRQRLDLPRDAWTPAGGRIYNTAMVALILQ